MGNSAEGFVSYKRGSANAARRTWEDEKVERQNAKMVCTIGTQPVIPAVYGVKAPL